MIKLQINGKALTPCHFYFLESSSRPNVSQTAELSPHRKYCSIYDGSGTYVTTCWNTRSTFIGIRIFHFFSGFLGACTQLPGTVQFPPSMFCRSLSSLPLRYCKSSSSIIPLIPPEPLFFAHSCAMFKFPRSMIFWYSAYSYVGIGIVIFSYPFADKRATFLFMFGIIHLTAAVMFTCRAHTPPTGWGGGKYNKKNSPVENGQRIIII